MRFCARSRPSTSTRSGASATWSATGRSRTAAAPSSRQRRTSACAETTTWRAWACSTCGTSHRTPLRARTGPPACSRPRRGATSSRSRLRWDSTGSASTTAARATPSGSTSSATRSQRPASPRSTTGSSSSATVTFRWRSCCTRTSSEEATRRAARSTTSRRAAWLLNPGSVGQPRDGDARAAWLLLDLEANVASFRRVAYAVGLTQAEILERGLPEPLAVRLAHGV